MRDLEFTFNFISQCTHTHTHTHSCMHTLNRDVRRAAWLVSWPLWSVLGEVFSLLRHQILQTLWWGTHYKTTMIHYIFARVNVMYSEVEDLLLLVTSMKNYINVPWKEDPSSLWTKRASPKTFFTWRFHCRNTSGRFLVQLHVVMAFHQVLVYI